MVFFIVKGDTPITTLSRGGYPWVVQGDMLGNTRQGTTCSFDGKIPHSGENRQYLTAAPFLQSPWSARGTSTYSHHASTVTGTNKDYWSSRTVVQLQKYLI